VTDSQPTITIDPVCGMTVDVEEARADGRTLDHDGRTYGFCSQGCLQEFLESPETYEGQVD
jgi:Cu+-exporting ATPase